ncbi:MAG: ArnT family glycosyltransferase [Candidatus Acidiferrales bacterium]
MNGSTKVADQPAPNDKAEKPIRLPVFTKYGKILVVIFVLTLPLVNPWVRGDGVGYYAFARSLLIERDLNFKKDWMNANPSFRMGRIDAEGQIFAGEYTRTGHIDNHFSIGPAILWSPFLIAAHVGVLMADRMGAVVPADGFSRPYTIAMGFATALYGFLALWISFQLARKYVPERWAFLGTLGIWFASSLPVYMYFNPSWSHAQSAFTVALFVWYWDKTRKTRTLKQWAILGAIGGLMMDVYYVTAILFLLPAFETLGLYAIASRGSGAQSRGRVLGGNLAFIAATAASFLPTLVTKKIIYGSFFQFGYAERWYWNSPALGRVAFSSDHGLFSWTPLLILAVAGLFALWRRDRTLSLLLLTVFAVYLFTIGCYQDWDGLSSFGSRFFVSLTVLFVVGLAAFFDWLSRVWNERRATALATAITAVFIVWNLGLIFQWGTHLIPARGPISWRDAAYNQVAVVPEEATRTLESYFTRRKQMMGHIEQQDVRQLKAGGPEEH